jgi:hypothetical protein
MNIRKPFQLLLLWLVVLGVYYPAIFAGINSVDDKKMLYSLEAASIGNLFDFFMPGQTFYYRPLLMLTFHLDYILWGEEVGFYHLENILIHGASVTLIFFILRHLLSQRNTQLSGSEWPLLGSLLFALHPIVTESVNWISGRTDLLGAFFVLAATLSLLQAIQLTQLRWVGGAVFLLGCGILSKEVMVFFVPAAAFLLWRWSCDLSRSWRVQALSCLLVPFVAGGGAFVVLRWLRHGIMADIDRLIFKFHYGAFDTVRVFFKVLGFYGKKIVAPLPLNFAIVKINDLYVLLGILIAVLAIMLFRKRRPAFDLVLVSWFLILPGILIALIGVAWTPLAERYVYLSSAFFVMGLSLFCTTLHSQTFRKIMTGGVALLLLPTGMATASRNLVWQDNAKLYADSLSKSPNFAAMNNELGIALIEEGKLTQASQVLEAGKEKKNASALLYINQARILMNGGKLAEAREEMLKVCADKKTANIEALKMLARIDEKRLLNGVGNREDVVFELIDTYKVLVDRANYPHLEYRAAQLLLSTGDRKDALVYFSRAYDGAPADAFYRDAARKFVDRLQDGQGG